MNYDRRALVVSAILIPGLAAVIAFRAYVAGYFELPRAGATQMPPAPPAIDQPARPAPAEAAPAAVEPVRLEDKWSIRILSASLSANGYMIDFRYRVLDAEKAKPLFDRRYKPQLIDEATGRTFEVPNPPKVGPLRNSGQLSPDRNYFILFANPGGAIKSDARVTLVIGDFRAEHIVVE